MPEQVSSQLDAANDLISDLRQTVVEIKELADEVVRLRARVFDAEDRRDRAEFAQNDAEAACDRLQDELDDWQELLEDFRRGVRDRDELIERTVGKHGRNRDTRTDPGTTARSTAARERRTHEARDVERGYEGRAAPAA